MKYTIKLINGERYTFNAEKHTLIGYINQLASFDTYPFEFLQFRGIFIRKDQIAVFEFEKDEDELD